MSPGHQTMSSVPENELILSPLSGEKHQKQNKNKWVGYQNLSVILVPSARTACFFCFIMRLHCRQKIRHWFLCNWCMEKHCRCLPDMHFCLNHKKSTIVAPFHRNVWMRGCFCFDLWLSTSENTENNMLLFWRGALLLLNQIPLYIYSLFTLWSGENVSAETTAKKFLEALMLFFSVWFLDLTAVQLACDRRERQMGCPAAYHWWLFGQLVQSIQLFSLST